MANHSSSKKRIRQILKRKIHNRYFVVTVRNAIKRFRELTDKTVAAETYPKVASMLDKIAKRGIIHKNKAANLKSKLSRRIAKLA